MSAIGAVSADFHRQYGFYVVGLYGPNGDFPAISPYDDTAKNKSSHDIINHQRIDSSHVSGLCRESVVRCGRPAGDSQHNCRLFFIYED